MRGDEITLDEDRATLLRRWAAKTWAMLQFDSRSDRVFPQEALSALRDGNEIPGFDCWWAVAEPEDYFRLFTIGNAALGYDASREVVTPMAQPDKADLPPAQCCS